MNMSTRALWLVGYEIDRVANLIGSGETDKAKLALSEFDPLDADYIDMLARRFPDDEAQRDKAMEDLMTRLGLLDEGGYQTDAMDELAWADAGDSFGGIEVVEGVITGAHPDGQERRVTFTKGGRLYQISPYLDNGGEHIMGDVIEVHAVPSTTLLYEKVK